MMHPRDSLTLAITKLRVRRIRLTVTLVVMSLLFAGLVFLSVIVAGAVHSVQSFGKEGLGSRYIVQGQPISYFLYDNQQVTDSLKTDQQALTAQKVAFAKKYDLTYDPKSDTTLPLTSQQTGPNATDVKLEPNSASSLTLAALAAQNNQLPTSYNGFAALAKKSGARDTYRATVVDYSTGGGAQGIQVLENGQEDYTQNTQGYGGQPTGLKSITSLGWNQMSDTLLQPFLLSGQSTKIGADGSVPITAPYSAATELLGLSKLPATATNKQKLERLDTVRKGVAGKLATICYRNAASQALLQQAVDQQKEIADNKGKKDYTAPSLQYNLPATACGPVTVKKDARTADEKLAADRQKQLDAISTPTVEPQQGIFTIRIVGITADVDQGGTSSLSAGGILSTILASNLGQGWLSPISAFKADTIVTQAQGGLIDSRAISGQSYFAEFATLDAAKQFIKQQNCEFSPNGSYSGPNQLVETCSSKKHYFMLNPYGNNAGAIADFQHAIWKYGRYLLLAVVIIAVFVMMGTLGKIIADSRRETAVFRALGARRLHISQIYLTYAVLLGMMIIGLSFVVGAVAAGLVNQKLEPGLSVGAVLAYNAADINKPFTLFSLDWRYLGLIGLIIIATSLLAAILPLLLNMRRNPIRDMREE